MKAYAEYDSSVGYPSRLEICRRCRRGILVYLGMGGGTVYEQDKELRPKPYCYTCGESEKGEVYVREAFL